MNECDVRVQTIALLTNPLTTTPQVYKPVYVLTSDDELRREYPLKFKQDKDGRTARFSPNFPRHREFAQHLQICITLERGLNKGVSATNSGSNEFII